MTDRSEYEARQAAAVDADDAIAQAAGVTAAKDVERPVCLVTSFAERADLPSGALLCRMSAEVAVRLAGMGLHEPVSLRGLPGRWWVVDVDAAAENPNFEPGGCAVRKVVTTEDIQHRYSAYYCQAIEGPYEPWANIKVAKAILDREHGKYWDACISNRPMLPVVEGESFSGSDNAYSSDDLLAALIGGKYIVVYSGPYQVKDDAHYALDVRWESPE